MRKKKNNRQYYTFGFLLVKVYARRQMLLVSDITGYKEINSLCVGLGILGYRIQGSQYRRVTFGELNR